MSAEPNTRKPRSWRAIMFWMCLLVALGVLGFFGHFWYQRYQADRRLQQVIAELDRDDPGWRLEDLQAAREVIPDAENGALVALAAGEILPKNWPPSHIEEALIKPAPNEQLSDELFRAIGSELIAHQFPLEIARKLVP